MPVEQICLAPANRLSAFPSVLVSEPEPGPFSALSNPRSSFKFRARSVDPLTNTRLSSATWKNRRLRFLQSPSTPAPTSSSSSCSQSAGPLEVDSASRQTFPVDTHSSTTAHSDRTRFPFRLGSARRRQVVGSLRHSCLAVSDQLDPFTVDATRNVCSPSQFRVVPQSGSAAEVDSWQHTMPNWADPPHFPGLQRLTSSLYDAVAASSGGDTGEPDDLELEQTLTTVPDLLQEDRLVALAQADASLDRFLQTTTNIQANSPLVWWEATDFGHSQLAQADWTKTNGRFFVPVVANPPLLVTTSKVAGSRSCHGKSSCGSGRTVLEEPIYDEPLRPEPFDSGPSKPRLTDSSVVRSRPDGTTRRARFLRSFSLSRRKTGQASVCAQETSRNRSSSPGRRVDPRKQGRTLPPGHEATGASGDSEKGCLPTNRSEAGRTSVADHQHPPNGQNPRARLTTTSASTIGCSRDRMPANRLERRNKRTPTPVAVTTNLVPPVKAPSPASRNRLSDFFLACRTNYRDRFPTNRRQATLMGTVVVDALSRGASQSCETKVGCRSPFSSTFSPSPSTSSAIARTVSNLLSDGSSGFALPSHSVLLSTPRDRFSTAFFTGSPGLPSRSCPTDFSEYIGHSAHLDMATLTRMLSDVSGESASRRTLSVCQKPAAETEACPSVQYGTVFYPLTPPQVTDQTGPWKPAWQQAVTRAATADSSVLLPSGHQTGPGPLEMHLIRSGQDRSFRPASYRSERTTSLLFPSNSERFHSSSQIKAAIPTGLARLEVARMDHSAQHLVSRRMSRLGRDQIYSNKTTACQQRPRSRKSASCPV